MRISRLALFGIVLLLIASNRFEQVQSCERVNKVREHVGMEQVDCVREVLVP